MTTAYDHYTPRELHDFHAEQRRENLSISLRAHRDKAQILADRARDDYENAIKEVAWACAELRRMGEEA